MATNSSALLYSTQPGNSNFRAIGESNPAAAINTSNPTKWGVSPFAAFIDRMKSAYAWKSSGRNFKDLDLDENGWPVDLPGGNAVTTQLMWYPRDVAKNDPGSIYEGKFFLIAEGEGRINLSQNGGGGVNMRNVKIDGKTLIEFDYAPNGQALNLAITSTDPNNTGNYIRNISIVHESHLELFEAGERFTPEYIDLVQDFRSIRFMQWMEANRNPDEGAGSFDDAITGDYYTYNLGTGESPTSGVPIDVIVELANKVGADPWINIPLNASDAYVRGMAKYIVENLDPRLVANVEMGNEMWNGVFDTNTYATQQAQKLWGGMSQYKGKEAWAQFSAMRGTQMAKIFENVFERHDPGSSDTRLKNIMGVKSSSPADTEILMKAPLWKLSDPGDYIDPTSVFDAIAVGGYFGATLGSVDSDIARHMLNTYGEAKAADLLLHYLSASLEPNYIGFAKNTFNNNGSVNNSKVVKNVNYSKNITIDVFDAIVENNGSIANKIKNATGVLNASQKILLGNDVHDYVRLTNSGGKTVLQLRFKDSGSFQTVLEFNGIVNKSVNQLIADGTLIVRGLQRDLQEEMSIRFEGQGRVAEKYGMEMLAYEGGHHISPAIWGIYRGNIDASVRNFLDKITQNSGIKDVYETWLEAWDASGGAQFTYHKDYSGDFGALSYIGQQNRSGANTPRHDFLEDLNNDGLWWNENRDAGTFLQGVYRKGANGNDTLFGTVEEDVILGGAGRDILQSSAGNDSLYGGAGADTFYAGAGDDVIVIDAADLAVRGEGGTDTVRLAFKDASDLDFTMGGTRVSGIEVIDLNNLANNNIWLDAGINLADGNQALTVIGEKGDSVTLSHATANGWVTKDGERYRAYKSTANGGQNILVEQDVSVSFSKVAPPETPITGGPIPKPKPEPIPDDDDKDTDTGGNNGNGGDKTPITPPKIDEPDDLTPPAKDDLDLDEPIRGTNRADTLRGEGGNDRIFGAGGEDTLYGGNGNDIVRGGSSDDVIYGGAGSDQLYGDGGNDTIRGGSHNDKIVGAKGNDNLYGASGNDIIDGNQGHDHIYGGNENDILRGGSGHDRLFGDNGNDRLIGGSGNDRLVGGSGRDVFVFGRNEGIDHIVDFENGRDLIDFGNASYKQLNISRAGSDVKIVWGNTTVILDDIGLGQINAADFI